jgi:hypothetical protein
VKPSGKGRPSYVLEFSLDKPVPIGFPAEHGEKLMASIPIDYPYIDSEQMFPNLAELERVASRQKKVTLRCYIKIRSVRKDPEPTPTPKPEQKPESEFEPDPQPKNEPAGTSPADAIPDAKSGPDPDPVPDFTGQRPLLKEVTFSDFNKESGLVESDPIGFGKNSVTLQFEKKKTGKISFDLVVKSLKQEITKPVRIVLSVDQIPIPRVSTTVNVKKVTEGDIIKLPLNLDFETIADENQGYLVDDDLTLTLKVYGFPAPKGKTKWASSWADDSKEKTGSVGLTNQGATCYMNAMLQALFHVPAFRRLVYQMPTTGAEDPKKSIPLNLQKLFCRMQLGDKSVSTKALTASFGWDDAQTMTQHDTQEFCRVLMDNLETKMQNSPLEGKVAELFRGKYRSYIRCTSIDYGTSRVEEFYNLALQVRDCPDLKAAFDKWIEWETLVGDN